MKLAAEEILRGSLRRTELLCLRLSNVYGANQTKGLMPYLLSCLRDRTRITIDADGAQIRDFVHVRDVATATVRAMEGQVDGIRAFNVGSGTPRTVGELAAALACAVDGPQPIITGVYRLGDVRHITADSSRLRHELDWTPVVPFAEGMAELAQA
jgi:dTDP-L-rhamnose 4-epimerase